MRRFVRIRMVVMMVMQNIGVEWIQHGELSVVAAGVAWFAWFAWAAWVHGRLVRMGGCIPTGVCVHWLTAYEPA